MTFSCRANKQKTKTEICVKRNLFLYSSVQSEALWQRLYSAENSTQQKKTRNYRKGANDVNYMKIWKLNIVLIFISYEQSSIRDCQPNIAPATEYNKMPGSPLGLEDKRFSQRWEVLKLLSKFPFTYTVQIWEKYHFKKRTIELQKPKWTEIQSNKKNLHYYF